VVLSSGRLLPKIDRLQPRLQRSGRSFATNQAVAIVRRSSAPSSGRSQSKMDRLQQRLQRSGRSMLLIQSVATVRSIVRSVVRTVLCHCSLSATVRTSLATRSGRTLYTIFSLLSHRVYTQTLGIDLGEPPNTFLTPGTRFLALET
jgi:hypothetical protein